MPVTSASVKVCVAATEAPARHHPNDNVAWQGLNARYQRFEQYERPAVSQKTAPNACRAWHRPGKAKIKAAAEATRADAPAWAALR